MKKIKLYLCLLFAAVLASCSDDSTERTIAAQPPITGKWYYSQQGQSIAGEDFLVNYTLHTAGCSKDNIVLGTDNSYRINEYSEENCQEISNTSTYSVNNNFITFGTGSSANTYEIESVTSTTLRLRQAEAVNGTTEYWVETFTRN
ncbi:hypothetical protein LRS05_01505 [Flavobacterium sp. J372]|uniref:hypothetical protein n=1 Tax=Flavobacterium sp. J372 TaxID=2898436 RepID=UPI002150F5FE|nr:hypothetical protein [Flavobacterium sp. J372]MCR5860899.1 hypothetical protein [Flavobacterium sp. J372]